jgi:hypothetical protein
MINSLSTDRYQTGYVELITVRFSGSTTNVARSRADLPVKAQVWDVALNPAGNRLAWLLCSNAKSPLQGPIDIYVSDTAGAGMRAIGSANIEGKQQGEELVWTPDGSRMSFKAGDSIYTLTAI